jgi:DNA-binding response OmpR family regulator
VRVLVVEDERAIADAIARGLRREGMAVDVAYDGTTGHEMAFVTRYDILVLDRDLPGVHGDAICADLVKAGTLTRVLMLTASGTVADKVAGLGLGADDYLAKPFAFDELLARIRARLRPRPEADATAVRLRDLELNLRTRRVTVGERSVELAPREFSLLETFLRNPGQVLSREQLLSRVWGYDFDPQSNLVDVYVGYLRRKLGDGYIETVRGAGYRLVPEP